MTTLARDSEELRETMAACLADTKFFAKSVFPDRFFRDFSAGHDEIFRLLDDDSVQKVAIAAPRGFGKTTLNTIVYPAKKILFREKKYIVTVSATASSALTQGENLKRELLTNRDILEMFGPMKTDQFSKEQWITQSGTMVMPRGAGQQIRGLLYDRYRPDLIIVDDLEDSEKVESQEQRDKLFRWFMSDLCNSIDRGSNEWKIVVIGTVLHQDSLLEKLLDDPDWASVRLDICDDEFNTKWPDFISTEEIKKLYNAHKRKGETDLFYREYRNLPISLEDAVFKPEYFKHYQEPLKDSENIRSVVIVDPAKTVKLQSADSAIVGWGIDRESHSMYVRDVVSGKLYPDELYNEMFEMCARLNAHILAVEVTSLNEFIVQPIKNEMRKRGIALRFEELKARGKKEERIAALAPFYRLGYIHHNETVATKLESQLEQFPRAKLIDVADAAAYIVELMEIDAHYFDPPDFEDSPDEWDELVDEPALDYVGVI